ncbi:MAG: Flp pilus assembly protein CpaB [Endomicrobiales bacterium]|nr:Flp pilus assembly protein CpaB [Endomicrobiales bacterium]
MKKAVIVPVLFAVLAALFTGLYLNSLETEYKKGALKTKVLVAKDYIDQGTILDGSYTEEKLVPKEYIQPKALTNIKELVDQDGRRVFITVVPVERGEQITTTKLSLLGFETGISAVIPTEKRALTLVFDGDIVSGILKPGNRVDIIGVFEYEDKNSRLQEAATTILQNVLVLSVGKSMLGAAKPSPNDKGGQNDMMMQEPYELGSVPVSFSVSPREAELLILASEKGTLKFSLRPMGDDKLADVTGAKMSDVCTGVSSTLRSSKGDAMNESAYKEMQKKQREMMQILKKYKK